MKRNRPGDGQSAQQKPWSEEIHVVLKVPSSKFQVPNKYQAPSFKGVARTF
jgi:hypothetical protein